jgi:hypothetical protein
MAKYNVGDKLVKAEVYMDGIFMRRPQPKKVVAVYEDKSKYLLLNPNDTATEPSTGDGNGNTVRYFFTFHYVDNNYRLANQEEIDELF